MFTTVSLTVDDVGAFTVRNLPTPGNYTVTFDRPGYQSATRSVDLQPGQQLSGLAITMAPTTGSVSGMVSDTNGPLGAVTVRVTGPGDIDFTTTSASVGAVGNYTFENLPSPATYTLTFSKDGYVAQTLLKELGAGGAGSVTGADTTLVASTARIRGVVQSATGQPVSGATVTLSDGSVSKVMLSADDPLGRFEFSGVTPGAYTLTAVATGTSPSVRLVNVIAADDVDLTVGLQPQASLSGSVIRLDGPAPAPYEGAFVRLFDASVFPAPPSQALRTVQTLADGSYNFGELEAPADYVVAVYAASTSADALDSALVQTQPSTAAVVPTFQIRVVQ